MIVSETSDPARAARSQASTVAVGIFLPMVPETVAALLAVMKLGAHFLPLFSGYGVDAVVSRLQDAGAKALIFADGAYRRGKATKWLPTFRWEDHWEMPLDELRAKLKCPA